jgi:aromatic ring-opening dioxygenase catalytic subunit (LigB family)
MLTSRALLVPSVPTLLIDERRGTSTPMLAAFAEQAAHLAEDAPDAIVVVTSRWVSPGAFRADDARRHESLIDLPGFGVEPRYDCPGEPALARAILEEARRARVRAAATRRGADTGVTVPLHLLAGSRRAHVVPVSVASAPREAHRAWGECLRRSLAAWTGRAALVVSGALTFSEHEFNLRRETPEARELEERALEAMRSGAWDGLAALEGPHPEHVQPEAGLLHLEVLRGFLGGDAAGRVCAYETLPGIGTALVEFAIHSGVEAK